MRINSKPPHPDDALGIRPDVDPESKPSSKQVLSGEKPETKRILLVMMQPPGSSGVQGLIYNKILPYLETNGWEFHFAGPSPFLASVLTESVDCPTSRLHYTKNISWSKRFSVLKNRQRKFTLFFFIYGLLQLIAIAVEKLVKHDSNAYLLSGISQVVKKAESVWNYDLIAGKSPDFFILDAVAELTREINKPLVAMVVDPHGKRDGLLFIPYERERQQQILDQCCGAMFMSPLTVKRYVDAGLVNSEKAYAFTDSYPGGSSLYQSGISFLKRGRTNIREDSQARRLRIVHLGMLPEWRPVGAMLEAILAFTDPISLDIFGYLYPEAIKQVQESKLLRHRVHCNKAVSYPESHHIAEDCDALLVVIGPRHLDNQPSKFFEYLGHRKPVLVIGPPGNPIEEIVNSLGIGLYCDASDRDAIHQGLIRLSRDYELIIDAFKHRKDDIEQYSAKNVAAHWSRCLNKMLNNRYSL